MTTIHLPRLYRGVPNTMYTDHRALLAAIQEVSGGVHNQDDPDTALCAIVYIAQRNYVKFLNGKTKYNYATHKEVVVRFNEESYTLSNQFDENDEVLRMLMNKVFPEMKVAGQSVWVNRRITRSKAKEYDQEMQKKRKQDQMEATMMPTRNGLGSNSNIRVTIPNSVTDDNTFAKAVADVVAYYMQHTVAYDITNNGYYTTYAIVDSGPPPVWLYEWRGGDQMWSDFNQYYVRCKGTDCGESNAIPIEIWGQKHPRTSKLPAREWQDNQVIMETPDGRFVPLHTQTGQPVMRFKHTLFEADADTYRWVVHPNGDRAERVPPIPDVN